MKTEFFLRNMEIFNAIDQNAAAQAAAHLLSRRDAMKLAPFLVEGGRQFIGGLRELLSPQAEQLKNFSGYIIGESTVGSITSLTTADIQHSDLDSVVRRSAAKVVTLSNTRGVPRLDSRNRLKTTIFNMNGITGEEAPLVILHETDEKGVSVGRAYLAFGLKNETVNGQSINYLTVPTIENVGILVTLKQYDYPNGEIVLGVPDLEKPEEINTPVFVIKTEKVTDKDGNIITRLLETSFLPPFAASSIGPVDAPKNTFTRVTIERARKQTEAPVETQLPPEITEKYLKQFESVETGKKIINSKETDVFYGVEKDGTKKVIAMEMEIDGELVMTRVGEYTDKEGFSYYTVMGKIGDVDGSMGGRFQVTDDTTKKIFEIDDSKNAVNIWNSLASQWGLTPEQARDKVMKDNKGLAKFNVAVDTPTPTADFQSKSMTLPNAVNFNLPIEIITIATHDAFNALPSELTEHLVFDHELRRISEAGDGDPIIGGLVWVKDNGQLQIVSVGTPVGHWNYLTPDRLNAKAKEGTNKYLKEHIVPQMLLAIDLISNPSSPVPSNGVNAYFSQINNIFEIDGFVDSSSQ